MPYIHIIGVYILTRAIRKYNAHAHTLFRFPRNYVNGCVLPAQVARFPGWPSTWSGNYVNECASHARVAGHQQTSNATHVKTLEVPCVSVTVLLFLTWTLLISGAQLARPSVYLCPCSCRRRWDSLPSTCSARSERASSIKEMTRESIVVSHNESNEAVIHQKY